MNHYVQMRSNLAKAKNLGSSGSGVHHWLHQRLAAIIMLPLMFWLAYFVHTVSGVSAQDVMTHLREPHNLIAAMLFLAVGLYHGMLGMQVVIEDYVSCLKARYFLIITMKIFTLVTIIASLVALFYR